MCKAKIINNKGWVQIKIYPHLGGWFRMGTKSTKKQNKNIPIKSILDHFKSF